MSIEPSRRSDLAEELVSVALASSSETRAQLMVGTAGIGKTHLLGLVRQLVEKQGFEAIPVVGSIAGRDIALAPFAGVVTALASLPDELSPVMAVIRQLTVRRRRNVLLIDNIDRLDPASLFVVMHCVRDARLPVVMTVRSMELLPEAVRELYDEGAVLLRQVRPLDLEESLLMAESLLAGPLTPRAASILVERSEGNPLYIRELIAGSRNSEVLVESRHGWDFRDPPQSTPRLTQLIGAAFDGLDDDQIDLVGLLAVSEGLPADLVDAVQIGALLRRGIVTVDRDGAARLIHPLFEEASLARSTPAALDSYRGRAFRLLSGHVSRDDAAGRARLVALGVAAGLPVPPDDVLAEAQHAQSVMDHDRAWRLSQIVLAEQPDHARASWIAGAAASGRGQHQEAERFLDRAITLASDEPGRAVAARSLAHHLAVRRHEPLRAVGLLHGTLASIQHPAERSRLEHDLLQWQMVGGTLGTMPAPPTASDEASYAHHLAVTLMVALIVGPLTEAEDKSRRLDEIMPRYQDEVPTGPAIARLGRFMLISYSGDMVAAREVAERFLRLDDDQPEMRGAWEYSLGMIELLSGQLDRAAQLAAEAVAHLRWRDPLGLLPAALALAEATGVATGDFAGAATFGEQIPEFMLADPKVVMLRAWSEAWRERLAGRRGSAADIIVAAAENLMVVRHVFLAGMLAHCAARAGYPDRALPVLAAAAEGGGVLELFHEHARVLVDQDIEEFDELIETFSSFGMLASAADGMTSMARLSRKRGDVMRARRWDWRLGQTVAQHPQMALWSQDLDSATVLSARERQVALLAAGRLSSREIGERLGITAKTVANQLGAVYRKLGVSGRAELREVVDEQLAT